MSPIDAAAAVFGHLQHHEDATVLHHSRAPYEENAHFKEEEVEVESNEGDRSATIILLKKFAKFVGNLIHDIGLDEVFFVQPIADITVTARILKEMLTSFMPKSKLQVPDIVEDISLDSSIYTISECQGASHLALLSSEMLLEDDNERLDYSISQLDVLRMSCAASKHLKVDSIDQLPTTIYHEEEQNNNNELICSSHEDEREEELPGDEQKMTGILNNVLAHQQRSLRQDDHPEMSWMIVPEDPLQDDLTRISQNSSQLQPKEVVVPESISICSSHQSDRKDVDHCVICQRKFQEGESLRVLPCEHLFHCGCIDKLLHNGEENAKDGDEVGCPMCKKELEEPQGESYHSDGSVPSWSFKKLGSLLASMSNK